MNTVETEYPNGTPKPEKRFFHKFTVQGGGAFPVDMLRYDNAFPASERESGKMDVHILDRREVSLACWQNSYRWQPEELRWESFGWVVKDHQAV